MPAMLHPATLRQAARELAIDLEHPAVVYLSTLSTKASRQSMLWSLKRAAKVLGASVAALDWSSLTYARMSFLRTCLASSASPATANLTLCAVRGVLRSCVRLGLMPREAMLAAIDLPPVRGDRPPKGRALTREEIASLFRACTSRGTRLGARDAALLALCYGCGLRRAEIAALRIEDVADEAVSVMGKGNKVRSVPVPADALPFLRAWVWARGPQPGPLFWAGRKDGDPRAGQSLSGNGVYRVLARLALEAGIKTFSPHDCRRTYIGDLLDLGVDAITVASLVGHESVETTQRYDRRPERARRAAVAKLRFPLDEKAEGERTAPGRSPS